jgi:hypothetical protein
MLQQFQTNINSFIIYIKNKINNDHNYMNNYELISEHLYNLVIENTISQNISIINYYSGSMIDAINKYIYTFGVFNFNDIKDFYVKLAFISLYDLICDEIEKELKDDAYSCASTVENDFEEV